MLRWLAWGGGAIGVVLMAMLIAGWLLPASHVASAAARFDRPPADVFAMIANVRRYAEWRTDVTRVDVLAEHPALRWKESGSNGGITYEREETVAPSRLRTRIADRSLPFGGTWTYEVTPSGSGTLVRITEHGEVYNPIFRVLSRFVFGHTAAMERFLRDLGEKLR